MCLWIRTSLFTSLHYLATVAVCRCASLQWQSNTGTNAKANSLWQGLNDYYYYSYVHPFVSLALIMLRSFLVSHTTNGWLLVYCHLFIFLTCANISFLFKIFCNYCHFPTITTCKLLLVGLTKTKPFMQMFKVKCAQTVRLKQFCSGCIFS